MLSFGERAFWKHLTYITVDSSGSSLRLCVLGCLGSDSVGAAAYLQYSKARTHILIRNSAGNIKYESNWTITRTLLIPNSDSYWILHLCCYQSPDQVYRASCGLSIITTEVEMEECSNILRTFLYHRSLGSNMLLSGSRNAGWFN